MDQQNLNRNEDRSTEFVRLLMQSQRPLYAFILSLVRRPADVDDVLQETNIVLWQKRESFQLGTDFTSWSFEVARRQALAFRNRQMRNGLPIDGDLLAELASIAQIELQTFDRRQEALQKCLAKLTPAQRSLITHRYRPKASVNAMAAELGKSAKAVSESLRRIRETLRQCVERSLAAESRP